MRDKKREAEDGQRRKYRGKNTVGETGKIQTDRRDKRPKIECFRRWKQGRGYEKGHRHGLGQRDGLDLGQGQGRVSTDMSTAIGIKKIVRSCVGSILSDPSLHLINSSGNS